MVTKFLRENGIEFDGEPSYLKYVIGTLGIILYEMVLIWIPVRMPWKVNERSYGALQGFAVLDNIVDKLNRAPRIW